MTINFSRTIIILITVICCLFFVSCKTLLFKNMFGSKTKIENPEDYKGHWQSRHGHIIAIKISEDSSAFITGYMKWNDGDKFRAYTNNKLIITKINDEMFINSKTDNGFYEVQQMELWKSKYTEKQEIRIWSPDIDKFEELMRNNIINGKIITKTNDEGQVETDSVIVDTLSDNEIERLMEKENLFKYKDVQTFRLIARPLEK